MRSTRAASEACRASWPARLCSAPAMRLLWLRSSSKMEACPCSRRGSRSRIPPQMLDDEVVRLGHQASSPCGTASA